MPLKCGEFDVDFETRSLRRGGVTTRLPEQPFQVLELLLEKRGLVVTREELRRRLWHDGTMVDFEHSVNAAIKRLRAALGDDAATPRYIETVPRRGYRVVAPVVEDPAPASDVSAVDRRLRLVVLPFSNLSASGERDYFSDGFTEEMIAQLGRRCGSHVGVLARTSSMCFKDAAHRVGDIGRALRADYLVEGSVRISGDRVRITAQLIETAGETHRWAQSFTREIADGLAVQEEVASEIAQALTQEIVPPSAECWYSRNPRAYEAYLTARFHWNKPGVTGLFDAVAGYDEALALDPSFGRAHSARARAYLSAADQYLLPATEALTTARIGAERALELDATDAEAWVVLGEVFRIVSGDVARADWAFQRALALNPNSEVAHRYYAWFVATHTPGPRAKAIAERAFDLDPLCLSMIAYVGATRMFDGDFGGALTSARRALALESSHQPAMRLASAALSALGEHDAAIEQFDSLLDRELEPASLAWKAHSLARAGYVDHARSLVDRALGLQSARVVPGYHVALAAAALGDYRLACEQLRRAHREHDPWFDAWAVDPRFEALRRDPSFRDPRSASPEAATSRPLASTATLPPSLE